jgi:hypothetical protein
MSSFDKKQVGNLFMKEYAAQKPLMVTADGKFKTAEQVAAQPSLGLGSLHALDEDLQFQLALERNRLEPDYTLGIFGVGLVTKAEILENIEEKTDFGREVVRAEVNYCNDLIAQLASSDNNIGATDDGLAVAPIQPVIDRRIWPWWIIKSRVLFCEDTTDRVTKYAARYRAKHVHPVFASRGFEIKVLEGVHDIRAEFEPIAKSKRVVYISGVGHGIPTTYTGHLGDPILRVGAYDPSEVRNKSIHLLSCKTAQRLGPNVISKGAKAYAGYFENFTFVIGEMELFWKADSKFDLMMANGATAEEAHRATIAEYNAAISSVPGTVTATWLTHDRNYLRTPVIDGIYGSRTARIFPWMLIRPPFVPVMEMEEVMTSEDMEEVLSELVESK